MTQPRPGVMSAGDARLWYQPETLGDLAVRESLWRNGRIISRPGTHPGHGPADTIRATSHDVAKLTCYNLLPVWYKLGAEGLLLRDFAVASAMWTTDLTGQRVQHTTTPALFGYASDFAREGNESTVEKLHKFCDTYGYEILDRQAAVDGNNRTFGALHVSTGGKLRPELGIGWQRAEIDIRREWAGINPTAMADLIGAHQIVMWSAGCNNDMWRDLAGFFDTVLAGRVE